MIDKAKTKTPGILTGLLAGALLTAPLTAVMYLGDQIAGFPFLPFDVFDWIARTLPGGLITFAIDSMVSIITTFNLGETSTAAKTAEQLSGLGNFLVMGAIAGAIFFFVMNRLGERANKPLVGLIAGLIFVAPLLVISGSVNRSATADPFVSTVWFVIIFAVWGFALQWVYNRLLVVANRNATVDEAASVAALNRRQFMVRFGAASATLTVIGAGLGAILNTTSTPVTPSVASSDDESVDTASTTAADLPNADAEVDPAPGTRPEYTPLDDHYRIDISSRPPVINGSTWTLPIAGLVKNPTEFTLEQLENDFESVDRYITLSCISNNIGGTLISTTKWTGIPIKNILDIVEPEEDAVALKITGADDFDEYVMLDLLREDDRIMLTYAWDDQPLKQKHGFPLRIYIPDHYGMKQPKWIVGMEFVDAWHEGYWVRRGWSKDAIVNTTSVVDTVAVDSMIQDGDEYFVPVGGIAYSGAKQISKVEVSVDDGEWEEAELRQPLSDLTWVIWRYNWKFEPGDHVFAVRAYDGAGELQITTSRGTRPDGATGIDTLRANLGEMEESA